MYVVNVMYPNPPGSNSTFNMQHYVDVHMAMGLGLLHRHYGVKPSRVEVIGDTYGPDRTNRSALFHCFGMIYFDRKEDADRFIDLFNMKEPVRLLSADWPKYTPTDPVAVLGRSFTLDPDEVIARGPGVIAAAERELATTA